MSFFKEEASNNIGFKRRAKKKYSTKYNPKYMEDYPWALSSSKGDTFAFCNLCKVDICIRSVGAKGLRDHESTCRHSQSAQQCIMISKELQEDTVTPEDHSNIIPLTLTTHNNRGISSSSSDLSTLNPEAAMRMIAKSSAPEMILSVENTTVISSDSTSFYYTPSSTISRLPISVGHDSAFSQETLSHAGISSSNCTQQPSLQPHNTYSVHLTSAIYCPFENDEKPLDESCSCPNPPLTPNTPSNLPETESYVSESSKFSLSSISNESMIQHVQSTPSKRVKETVKNQNTEASNSNTKDSQIINENLTNVSIDSCVPNQTIPTDEDLTCNICGVLFSSWKELKNDLESHVKDAQQSSKKKTSPKKSPVRGNKREDDKDTIKTQPRRRGRPLGSKNKTIAVLGRNFSSKDSKTSKCPHTEKKLQGRSKQIRNLKKTGTNAMPSKSGSKRCSSSVRMEIGSTTDGAVDLADLTISDGDVTELPRGAEPLVEIIESSSDLPPSNPLPRVTPGSEGSKRRGQIHCRICKAPFYSRKELRVHFQTHNNGRPFECEFCHKYFTTKNHLKVHESHKHSNGPNPCECSTCGKVLSSRTNLKIHMKIHKGEKHFECPICKKQFSRKANMEMHTVYHTGERRFTCEVCGQSFFAINALKRHTKLHTGERNFACETCGATYVTGTDLRRHRLKHQDVKPYPCTLCRKQFTRSHDLKIHTRYHTKDMRFTCNLCGRQFVESGNYRRHMRRHTGERPYMCNICMQTFSQVHHYKLHMRCNHADELDSDSETKHSKKLMIHKNPSSSQKMSSNKQPSPKSSSNANQLLENAHSHATESQMSDVNGMGQNLINVNLISNQPHRHHHSIQSGSSTIAAVTSLGSSGISPIAHTVNVPVMQATHNIQVHQSPGNHPPSWNLPYNSFLYNSGVLPQYPGIVDVCPPQQSSAHTDPH